MEATFVDDVTEAADKTVAADADALAGIDFVNPGGQGEESNTEPLEESVRGRGMPASVAPSPQPSPSERGSEGVGDTVIPPSQRPPDVVQAEQVERTREELRREFQSQKDREIHRERQRWEEERRAQDFQRSLESLPDAEVARQVREQQRERVAAAKARTEAMGTIYAEVGKAMQTVPEFGELEEADWDNLLRQGSFGEFLAAVVDRGVKRRFGDEVEKRATELAEAKFRERMAAIRPGETSPDLTPAAGPSPTFENLESRYLAGELSLADYTDARRRRGLEVY